MADLIQCPSCTEEVTADSDFCPHCGILFDRGVDVFCETHPENTSSGVCIICRKVVCKECSKVVRGRQFCLSHNKVEVQQDWAKIYQSTEINDAELVRSFLGSQGFTVLPQNFNSIGFVWDGGGDSPQSRSNLNKPAKVFVPIPEYVAAQREFEEWATSNDAMNNEQ